MNKLVFYQSGDISDSITDLTNAVGDTLTFLLIVGVIIYLILRGIANRSNKKDK